MLALLVSLTFSLLSMQGQAKEHQQSQPAAHQASSDQQTAGGNRNTNQQAANTGAGKTRSPASLLKPDPLDVILRPVDRGRGSLDRNQHLAITSSYTFLNQYASNTRGLRHDQISGRLDFQAVWTFQQHPNGKRPADQSSLNLLLRSGTNIGQSQQWDLSNALGSALGTNSLQGGGPQRPIMINLLYLKQTWDAQRVAFYVGKLHPNQHIGLSPVNNDETSQFLGGPFDGDPAQTELGAYTSGVALEIGPQNGAYMHAIAVDAKGTAWRGSQTIFDGRYYEAVELGWKRGIQGEGGRDLRAAYYHQNPPGLGHGHSIGFGVDWEFKDHWMPFGRLGFDTRSGTAVRQLDTVGLTHVLPFGRKGDMFGAAMTWTLPSSLNARRELLSEVFYRLKVSNSLEFSSDLQFLHHPSLKDQVNSTVLMGARLKVIF